MSAPTAASPKTITGGCVCGAVRYRLTLPDNFDAAANSGFCQCTQCRKQTGSLFFPALHAPDFGALEWLKPSSGGSGDGDGPTRCPGPPPELKTYNASPTAERAFCGTCGAFLLWRKPERGDVSLTIGAIDALYLIGEGTPEEREAAGVPEGGFGNVLCGGKSSSLFCSKEIKGVTDDMELLHRGPRFAGDDE